MGLSHSPRIVTTNLLLNVDAGNIKNYDGRQNLLTYSELFTNAAWLPYELTVAATTGISSPINSSVFKITESTTASVQHTLAQSPGNSVVGEIFTFSVYLKAGTRTQVSLTSWGEGYAAFDLSTGTVIQTGGHVCSITSVGDGWYRCSITVTKTQTTNYYYIIPWNGSHIYTGNSSYFYATGAMLEKNSYVNPYVVTTSTADGFSNTITSTISSYTLTRTNPTREYAQYNNGVINFTRAANNTVSKNVAGDNFQVTITQTNLKPSTFLYNDFTWEVWFKPNDLTPSNYDGTEGTNAIIAYRGWHQGFTFDTGSLNFWILNNTGPAWDGISTTIGTSTGNVRQGNWHQAVVTRAGTLYTMYINGVSVTSKTVNVVAIADGAYTSNELHIGGYKYYNAAATDGYFWHSKMDFACSNMYNRALSDMEIKQNFNALRGRFGI